jgi:hypothetical protein
MRRARKGYSSAIRAGDEHRSLAGLRNSILLRSKEFAICGIPLSLQCFRISLPDREHSWNLLEYYRLKRFMRAVNRFEYPSERLQYKAGPLIFQLRQIPLNFIAIVPFYQTIDKAQDVVECPSTGSGTGDGESLTRRSSGEHIRLGEVTRPIVTYVTGDCFQPGRPASFTGAVIPLHTNCRDTELLGGHVQSTRTGEEVNDLDRLHWISRESSDG